MRGDEKKRRRGCRREEGLDGERKGEEARTGKILERKRAAATKNSVGREREK